ncbi:MAG: sulfatase-like hydrolase/transferase [Verrucomicrobiota bacterium]
MDDRPNILWYCTDQQRFDTIGALGNPHVRTPVIDGLVREGMAFTHVYCQSPICTPSRSSFMTGLYPSRLHSTRNGNDRFPSGIPVITRLIADAGYHCGLVGKFHLQSSGKRTEPRIDDGFSYWKFSHAPRDDWQEGHDYADWVRSQGGDLNALRESEDRVPTELHQTTWASERSIEFIRQEHDGPWLLNVNPYDPHPPFIPPCSYAEQFDPADMPGPHLVESDRAAQEQLAACDFQNKGRTFDVEDGKKAKALYYAMIAQIDDQFARILQALDETGQRKNTVIIFTSDHGESLGDHGLMFKGARFYEGLVRVPLILSWPGQFRSGLQSDALVEMLDLTATLLDLAGVPSPDYQQGKTLVPILRGEAESEHRHFVRSEYFDALDPVFTGGTGTFATMHRTRKHKLVVYHGKGVGELFDLENDPWEHRNLWDDPEHAEVKNRLIAESFDAHVLLTTDVGSERIAPM